MPISGLCRPKQLGAYSLASFIVSPRHSLGGFRSVALHGGDISRLRFSAEAELGRESSSQKNSTVHLSSDSFKPLGALNAAEKNKDEQIFQGYPYH